MALNHICLQGRICNEIELRRTNAGVPVASFTLAVDRDFSKDGAERETDFIEVVCWKNTAEFVNKYFGKGRMAIVSGRLQIRNWQDKEGNKRKNAEVVADNVYFGDSKKEEPNKEEPNSEYTGFVPNSVADPASDFAMLTDDDAQLPF